MNFTLPVYSKVSLPSHPCFSKRSQSYNGHVGYVFAVLQGVNLSPPKRVGPGTQRYERVPTPTLHFPRLSGQVSAFAIE